MKTHITHKDCCAWCGHTVDRATSKETDDPPGVGDLSLCLECGEWNVFDDGLHLRVPTDEEFDEIGTSPKCMEARAKWTEFKRWRDEQREPTITSCDNGTETSQNQTSDQNNS